MPDQRLERTRATLPAGYQFSDARWPRWMREFDDTIARRVCAEFYAKQAIEAQLADCEPRDAA